jgi:hypothetical protein
MHLTLSKGLSSPIVAPVVAHEWRWRSMAELPPGAKRASSAARQAESDYERLLADQPARIALGEILAPFLQLAELLEPCLVDQGN